MGIFRRAFALALLLPATSWAADAPAEKEAVAKSLTLLTSSCRVYAEKKSCFSCHHQALPVMAMALAKQRGFAVDSEAIDQQAEFTLKFFRGRQKQMVEGKGVPGGAYTAGYGLLCLAAGERKADETTDAMVEYLCRTQREDGNWSIGTHRPPMEDSDFAATALAVRGMLLFANVKQKESMDARLGRARQWLIETPDRTTEDKVFKLFGLHWIGGAEDRIAEAVEDLLAGQERGGGWPQSIYRAPDAYATGQVLVALHQAGGLPVTDSAYRQGIEYLLRGQYDDGSWMVATWSRPIQTYFESGFPHKKSQFISISGTCWATMALSLCSESTPAKQAPAGDVSAK